jgi:hypothetical protein
MKPSQIAQLQDLSKCYMPPVLKRWVVQMLHIGKVLQFEYPYFLEPAEKARLRRLTHQYRNQIAAIKRNQERA